MFLDLKALIINRAKLFYLHGGPDQGDDQQQQQGGKHDQYGTINQTQTARERGVGGP